MDPKGIRNPDCCWRGTLLPACYVLKIQEYLRSPERFSAPLRLYGNARWRSRTR